MEKEKEELIKSLYENVKIDNFINQSYNIVEKLSQYKNLDDTIEPIIKLIELNPDIDFGNPGPLVHYLEGLDEEEYAIKLIESLKRNPTEQTLFMFNRMINGVDDYMKEEYLHLLESINDSLDISENIKSVVQDYLSFQRTENEITKGNKLQEVDIVLIKPLSSKSDLIKIKKILGLEQSTKELLDGTSKLPYTLIKSISIGRAKKKVNELGDISLKIQLV
ncbi:hypothetical protein [Clostridium aciditolerans]|uniref:Uncharacterized protein n=1 Tax=Clostridium aciditolerans TaxID=339861 RepID=A0A934HV08_9CLOT|nr:hypothetical protein [Clostridium aciditolerans]MBI6871343.1 hypothetical protein [Clostridium aciditolerans]